MQFKTKMILIGIIPLLVSMSVISVSTYKVQSADRLSSEIIEANMKMTQLKNDLGLKILEIQRKLWMGNALDADKRARKEMMFQTEDLIAEFLKNKNDIIELNKFSQVEGELKSLSSSIDDYLVPVKAAIQLMVSGSAEDNLDAKEIMIKKFPDKVDALSFSMNQYSSLSSKISNEELEDLKKQKQKIYITIFSILAGLLALSVLGILYFSKSLSRSLEDMIHELSDAIQNTVESSEQILSISQVIASNSTEQATAIQQTVAAMEEISAAVKNNSDQAQSASTASRSGTEKANSTVNSINVLASKMDFIQASSRKVEEVISVIDDIAFQTNLLALNAAVEAARAGEQGKGFAVVADAVRSLAAKTAESAKIVSQLINTTTSQVTDGVKSTHENSDNLLVIVEEIKKISKMNDNIALASSEQSQGVQEINKTLQEFDQATQKNSVSAEEAEETAKNLEIQSQTLKEIIKKLQKVMYGAA